jgi:uncharacterized protein (UPF0333 family)
MFSFSFSFSKPRIISIVLLLAILVMSLFLSSYVEGMESDTIATVNKDAPNAHVSEDSDKKPLDNTPLAGAPLTDGISLGSNKILSVSDITGVLQNNPGVQKLISNKP